MPQGSNTLVPYSPPPVSTPNAIANVPNNQIYNPSNGVPAGGWNSGAVNSSLPMAGGDVYTQSGLSPAGAAFLNKLLPGNNFQPWTPDPSNGALGQQLNGIANQNNDTQTQISNVQQSIDDNQTNNQSLFGFQSQAYALNSIWRYNDSDTFYNPVENILINAGAGGAILMSQCLLRLVTSQSFLVQLNFCEASQGFPDVENLNAAIGTDIGVNQAPLDYLNSVLGGYPWENNHNGTGLTGMDWISSGDGISRSYYWSPQALTIQQMSSLLQTAEDNIVNRIFHLWDYTPASGGPTRNGITDFAQIIALFPLVY